MSFILHGVLWAPYADTTLHLNLNSSSSPTAISPPTNLQFSQVSPTSFTMRWAVPGQENRLSGLTGLTGYRVVVNPKNKSGPTKEINLAPDATQAHISGLMVSVALSARTYECYLVQYLALFKLVSRRVSTFHMPIFPFLS